jgi:hypothetical protein
MTLTNDRSTTWAARAFAALVLALAFFACTAAHADASPGALKILIVESYPDGTLQTMNTVGAQLRAEPGVAAVDEFEAVRVVDGGTGAVPSVAELSQYDAVVAMNNFPWSNVAALGNALADYVDSGGVVFADVWNSWDPNSDTEYALLGRWATGEYSPFLETISGKDQTQIAPIFDAANPVFTDVGTLANIYTYANATLAPGATKIATWQNGTPAVAIKGRVVSTNAWLGDDVGNTGNWGRLVVNSIKRLGAQVLTVKISGSGAGSVFPTAGLPFACTATECTGTYSPGTPLTVVPKKGASSVFTGWKPGCPEVIGGFAGCKFTIGSPIAASAQLRTPTLEATFASVKLKIGKLVKNKLSVTFPGPGKLVVTGAGLKPTSAKATKAGTLKLKLKPKSSLTKRITKSGSASVQLKLVFTPTGAQHGISSKKSVKFKR